MKRAAFLFALLVLSPVVACLVYLAVWAAVYRIPAQPALTIDRRASPDETPHYLSICSSLADLTSVGYPGHCYVVFSHKYPLVLAESQSFSFVPRYIHDQIVSLFDEVPGVVVQDAWRGNLRNFDCLTVVVCDRDFGRALAAARSWSPQPFRVGVRDCVSFCHHVAGAAGISRPDPAYKYPQDWVRELKALNRSETD